MPREPLKTTKFPVVPKMISSTIEQTARYSDAAVEGFCKILLVALVLIVTWVVFGRYVLGQTPQWGEQLALMLMVWFGLLSASMAIRRGAHLKLAVLDLILPAKYLKPVHWFYIFVAAAFALFLIWSGIKLVELTSANTLSGLNISSAWQYLAVPVSGLAILVQILDKARELS